MFHDMPEAVRKRMRHLESIDSRDRRDGTPRIHRLRQIPPETGRFIALLAASAPDGACIEVGTSAGYSTLWLALACARTGKKLTTFEVLEEKARIAGETLRLAGVEEVVTLVVGDAREHLPACKEVSFCFLDVEKEIYRDCYEAVVPNLVRGGILVADNAVSHADELRPMIDRALGDVRVDALVVPVGKGVLVCRLT